MSASASQEPTYVLTSSGGSCFLWWFRVWCIWNPALVLAINILSAMQHSVSDHVGRLKAERQPT